MAARPILKITGSEPKPKKRDAAQRWTPALAKSFTPVSDYFLENYHRLPLPITSLEAMFIIHLMRHKWDSSFPYPSFRTVAKRMGVTPTAVRNHARSLEHGKRYLRRIMRTGQPNLFDLTPLFSALEKLQAADEREAARKSKVA